MEFQFSFSSIAFLIIIFLFGFFFYSFKLVATGNKRPRYPPGPPKLPLIGNIHQLVGVQHHVLTDMARKYGPIMRLKFGEMSVIVVSSPRLAKEVTTTHDVTLADRPQNCAVETMFEGVDLGFSPYGDYWRQMHKICVEELLSKRTVQSFRAVREEESRALVASVRSSAGSVINLSKNLSTLSNSVIWKACVGESKNSRDQDIFLRLSREFVSLLGTLDMIDLFPSLKFLHPLSRTKSKILKIKQGMSEIIDKLIDEHREAAGDQKDFAAEKNMLDVLLRLQENNTFEFPITSLNIKAIVLDMCIAGTDSSSMASEWALTELIRNPRVMDKAVAEVRTAFNGKKTVQEVDVQELKYLKLVIKETLRLHPPGPLLLPKLSRKECEIDGYTIPAKTQVIVNAWAMGRDPELWDDPERFKPERFEGSSVDFKGRDAGFIPFGAGRRMCPGMTFGLAVVEIALAQLLYHFSYTLPDGLKPEDIDMTETSGVASKKCKDLLVVATPYSPSFSA